MDSTGFAFDTACSTAIGPSRIQNARPIANLQLELADPAPFGCFSPDVCSA